MSVGHRDHNDALVVYSVDQRVRKTRKQASSYLWFDFCGGERIRSYAPDDPIRFVKKAHTSPLLSLIKPADSFIDLLFRKCEEMNVHLPL